VAKKTSKSASKKASSRTVNVGLTQMACTDKAQENLARQLALVEAAAKKGADIICTQELFTSQYFCQVEDHRFFQVAEPIPGPSTEALSKLAKKYGVVIIGSLFERRAAGLYHNTAVILDADGSLAGMYRKMHIPDDPLYYEKFYFTPGDLGFRAFDTKKGRIGTLICWDQWFPEGARLTAMAGAEILFYPTAIGWHPSEKAEYGEAQHDSWELMQRSHAVGQRLLRLCAQPHRPRADLGHQKEAGEPGRHRVLGPVLCFGAQRQDLGSGFGGSGAGFGGPL
jgi:N-carbamoylputrescine amidase